MSIKTRFFAAAVAASLLVGTASFAASEPRQARRVAIEESQSFMARLFDWVRELVEQRREQAQSNNTERAAQLKDSPALDPNGGK